MDTHYLIWLATDMAQLTTAEHALLSREDIEIWVSPVSIWEVRLKWQARDRDGNRKGVLAPAKAITVAERTGFKLATLTSLDCAEPLASSMLHKDPFDEMLLIHAQQLGARFLTRDRLLVDHPLAITP